MSKFDTHGGYFAPLGYMKVNEGGSHEENPNGGVQVGVDPEGVPNLLEEGEPVFKDFVFSDNIKAKEKFLKQFGIPEKYAGKLYSEIADSFLSEAELRPNDEISANGLNAMLGRLAEAQEAQKAEEEEAALMEELKNMSPEELAMLEQALVQEQMPQKQMMPEEQMQPEAVPEMVAPEQVAPEAVAPEMPVMARGGKMFKYGGDEDDPPYQAPLLFNPETGRAYTAGHSYAPVGEIEPAYVTAYGPNPVRDAIYEGQENFLRGAAEVGENLAAIIPETAPVFALRDAYQAYKDFDEGNIWRGLGHAALAVTGGAGKATEAVNAVKGGVSKVASGVRSTKGKIPTAGKVIKGLKQEAARTARQAKAVGDNAAIKTKLLGTETELRAEANSALKKSQGYQGKTVRQIDYGVKLNDDLANQRTTLEEAYKAATAPNAGEAEQKALEQAAKKYDDIVEKISTNEETIRGYGKKSRKLNNEYNRANRRIGMLESSGSGYAGLEPGSKGDEVVHFLADPAYLWNRDAALRAAAKEAGRKGELWGRRAAVLGQSALAGGVDYGLLRYGAVQPIIEWADRAKTKNEAKHDEPIDDRVSNSKALGGRLFWPGGDMMSFIPWHNLTENRTPLQWAWWRSFDPENRKYNLSDMNPSLRGKDGSGLSGLGMYTGYFLKGPATETATTTGETGTKRSYNAPASQDAAIKRIDWTSGKLPVVNNSLNPWKKVPDNPVEAAIAERIAEGAKGNPAIKQQQFGVDSDPENNGFDIRLLSPLVDVGMGFANLATPADRYDFTPIRPYLPSGRIALQDQRYMPIDMNMITNQMHAQNTANARAILNSGAGPSTGALINAADYTGGIALGNALANIWQANNQERNRVIAANNQNAATIAQFDRDLDAERAQILNNMAMYNNQNALRIAMLNNQAEQDKYNAVAASINSGKKFLNDYGWEMMNRNMVNSNRGLLGYGIDRLNNVVYDRNGNPILLAKYGGKISKKK